MSESVSRILFVSIVCPRQRETIRCSLRQKSFYVATIRQSIVCSNLRKNLVLRWNGNSTFLLPTLFGHKKQKSELLLHKVNQNTQLIMSGRGKGGKGLGKVRYDTAWNKYYGMTPKRRISLATAISFAFCLIGRRQASPKGPS